MTSNAENVSIWCVITNKLQFSLVVALPQSDASIQTASVCIMVWWLITETYHKVPELGQIRSNVARNGIPSQQFWFWRFAMISLTKAVIFCQPLLQFFASLHRLPKKHNSILPNVIWLIHLTGCCSPHRGQSCRLGSHEILSSWGNFPGVTGVRGILDYQVTPINIALAGLNANRAACYLKHVSGRISHTAQWWAGVKLRIGHSAIDIK